MLISAKENYRDALRAEEIRKQIMVSIIQMLISQ